MFIAVTFYSRPLKNHGDGDYRAWRLVVEYPQYTTSDISVTTCDMVDACSTDDHVDNTSPVAASTAGI